MGYAPLGGIHAMSLAVLVTAGALLTLWLGTHRERAVAAAVVAAVWLGGLAAARSRVHAARRTGTLDVALAQGAIAQETKYDARAAAADAGAVRRAHAAKRGRRSRRLARGRDPDSDRVRERLCSTTVRRRRAEQGSTLLLGALRTVPAAGDAAETFQNILLALTDEPQIYVKRHLVPFGEYFPVPDFIRDWMRLMNLPYSDCECRRRRSAAARRGRRAARHHDLLRGRVRRRAAPLPARRDAARERQQRRLVRRFDRDPQQHLQIARVRAAEAGRYLLRAANRGITAVIDPHGARRRDDAAVPRGRAASDGARLHGRDAVRARRQLPSSCSARSALAAVFVVARRRGSADQLAVEGGSRAELKPR